MSLKEGLRVPADRVAEGLPRSSSRSAGAGRRPSFLTRLWQKRTSVLVLAVLPVLGACSAFEDEGPQQSNCPSIGTLEDARTLTRFEPGVGTNPSAARLQVRIADAVPTSCAISGANGVVEMQVRFDLSQPASASGERTGFGYFVAISDPDSRIIAREGFELAMTFPDDRTRASATDDIVTTIPLPPGARLEDYRLLVGLQLTPEELDYNRRTQPR